MVKPKAKRGQNASSAKNRHSAKQKSKAKSVRVQCNSGRRPRKKKASNTPRVTRSTQKKARVAVDTKFWRAVARRTATVTPRASYARKSLRSREGVKYAIKKKIKQVESKSVLKKQLRKEKSPEKKQKLKKKIKSIKRRIRDDVIKYIKPKKNRKAYIKIAARTKKGAIKFISAPRREAANSDDVDGQLRLLFERLGYEKYAHLGLEIAGYEVEVNET